MTYKKPRSVVHRKHRRSTLATVVQCPNCLGDTVYVVDTDFPSRFRYCLVCDVSFHIRYNRQTKQWYRVNTQKGKPE